MARVGTSPCRGSTLGTLPQAVMGFLHTQGMAQTWLPDGALTAGGKVHHLIFTDCRASRGLKWLLLFIKLMVCFLWVFVQLGARSCLEGAVNTITSLVLHCKFSVVFFALFRSSI